ncbi:AtzG-like protein [Noviherbaspirillum galbum]|uniref:DUF4089 domain-containing protein n=1 Tax=Noviherbaspirillum galbum TaxID=2709383 RepID=A0A6B3SJ84_9BURK|nr:AtzG-like protein [Noviherbaspirillum galbum]NEX60783.1 DUF4089 domain-containing protein [Noviherbaspirillum galbum]
MPLNLEDYIVQAALAQALPIAPDAVPAVVAAAQLLESMAQEVMSFALEPHIEPAQVFVP